MLDYVYEQSAPAGTSARGAWVFAQTTGSSCGASVRERKRLLADLIDHHARVRPGARILSVGSGHLREAQSCQALRGGGLAEVVAVDQDLESLSVVQAEQGRHGVVARRLSIKQLATAPQPDLGEFDLVYSAGVFDYLPDLLASRLMAAMFGMLRPGGSMMVANFVPANAGAGYMEAFMDWRLLYRDPDDLARLLAAAKLPGAPQGRIFLDRPGNVAYLQVQRA